MELIRRKRLRLLILGREKRFLAQAISIANQFPFDWEIKILSEEIKDCYDPINKNVILEFYPKENKKVKWLKKKISSFNLLGSNYIYYADYCLQIGLKNHPYGSRNKIDLHVNRCVPKIMHEIEKRRPDLIFYETIDRPEIFYAAQIAKRKKILALEARIFGESNLSIYPASGIYRKNPLFENKINLKIKRLKKSFTYEQAHKIYLKNNTNKFELKKVNIKKAWYYLRLIAQKLFEKNYLKNHIKNKTKCKKILFFPLSHAPESSTFSEAPVWSDPLQVILRLSSCLPNNWDIWVKEHPRTLWKRPFAFYERISKMPGCTLFHPSFPVSKLVKNSDLCLVVTSTVGLMTWKYKKPSEILGRPAWADAPWIHKIVKPEDVFQIEHFEVSKKKSKEWLKRFSAATFPLRTPVLFGEPEFGRSIAEMLQETFFLLKNDGKA